MMRYTKVLLLLGFCFLNGQAFAEQTVIGYKSGPFHEDPHDIYKPGKQLPDDHVFKIPSCRVLIVLRGDRFIEHGETCKFDSGERQDAYENYFHKFCEIGECTSTCKLVYSQILNKPKHTACP